MSWVAPEHSRADVNRAARILVNPIPFSEEQAEEAFDIIGNWRSSHSFPLNTFKIGLLKKAKQVDEHCIVVQRLKRLSSIGLKLHRFPEMKLSQMQDIAGCRTIVSSVAKVYELAKLYKSSDIKHKLVHEDDYIKEPKDSGYRSIHLVYRYFSDRKETYNDLKVEIQMRSALQHAWATAVETVGTFIQQALKSSQGEDQWLRFFALMGSFLAIRERAPIVPNTPASRIELRNELRDLAMKLDVENHLRVYAQALQAPEEAGASDAHYFLLELDPAARHIRITGYKSNELERASNDYLAVERRAITSNRTRDAVLVSADSMAAVKRAYPNYFLDTHRFISMVQQAVGFQRWRRVPAEQGRLFEEI